MMANGLMQSGDTHEGLEALLQRFRDTLPREAQDDVLRYATNNPDMPSTELAARMRNELEKYGQANGLVAAPNGMELHNEVGELRRQYENGLTTHTSEDIERLTFAVQNTVKQMIAQGASDADIQQAVGQLPGVTPELSAIAQQVAQQQLDAEKFALLDTRNQEPAVAPAALTLGDLLTTPMMELAAPIEEPEQQAAQSANPFASLLAGMEISRELRVLNAGSQATASLADTGQLGTQLASQSQQRSVGDSFSVV